MRSIPATAKGRAGFVVSGIVFGSVFILSHELSAMGHSWVSYAGGLLNGSLVALALYFYPTGELIARDGKHE